MTNSPELYSREPPQSAAISWLDDACLLDMDYFIKTLTGIKAKGVQPDLIGSIITHYASKWLPDLFGPDPKNPSPVNKNSPESVTALWMKKRFFVETLVGLLPPEGDSISCNFLLRLLKTANMVGVESTYIGELEKRISWQLDKASLGEIMIPCFSHKSENLYDVELVIRLVKRFVNMDGGVKSGEAVVKVAKLVDAYLAEAAVDSNLGLPEFVTLAGAVPEHARVTHDGLYRAIDTYLKAHPGVSKEERKRVCRLIDSQKLTSEASLHAAQNERLPVRAVIQALFSEQSKVYERGIDVSRSFNSPSLNLTGSVGAAGRCLSKREMTGQNVEIRRLKEEMLRLQSQCFLMQGQIERMIEEKKKKKKKSNIKKGWFLRWRKLILLPSLNAANNDDNKYDKEGREMKGEYAISGRQTPIHRKKTKLAACITPTRRRKSIS